MHEQQRKFFASNDRFRIISGRDCRRTYSQRQSQATLEAKSNLEIIAIDECKEMTKEDFEEITDCLRGRMELQSFISTENSDWLREYSKEQGKDES